MILLLLFRFKEIEPQKIKFPTILVFGRAVFEIGPVPYP